LRLPVRALFFIPFQSHEFRAGHDSSISIVYPGGPTIYNIRISSLPFVTLTWTAEDTIVAAGHDCQPVVFAGSEGGWQGVGSLDDSTSGKSANPRAGVGRLNSVAFSTFRDADSRGHMGASASTDTKLLTVHQNTITSVRPYEFKGGRVSKVSTSGVDGNLVIWDADEVSASGVVGKMGGMRM
jgi:actin related protein 2/3 complex subunit 1A/1B